VHLVLEEAPVEAGARPERPYYLFPVSAKTEGALESATTNLADYLDAHPESNLRDAAWTCQVGRRAFPWRRALVAFKLAWRYERERRWKHEDFAFWPEYTSNRFHVSGAGFAIREHGPRAL